MKTATSLVGFMAAAAIASPAHMSLPPKSQTYGKVNSAPFGYKAGSAQSVANLKAKVHNVVWILLENRSFDNILGGVKRPGMDNPINNGPFCNAQNVSDPKSEKWCTGPKDFDSVLNDPNHSVTGNNLEFYGTYSPNNTLIAEGKLTPSMDGFVNEQLNVYPTLAAQTAAKQVMNYYTEDEIPTLVDLVDEFTTFNYWHSCVPAATNPNRLCALAGTSAGHGFNDADFSGKINTTGIFEVVDKKGISWLEYDGTNGAFDSDALFFTWVQQNRKANNVPVENFFQDAYLGQLPQLSYINPSCCGTNTNSMHPTGNVSYGEIFVKQIYDAVRNGPQWENTLLLLTYDESGGFHDHIAPPLAVRPDTLTYTEKAKDGSTYTFEFDRLGGRMPTWLISPYAPKGYIENFGIDPATGKPYTYSATSVLKTLGLLWDLEDLTPRVSHSPSFDHLIGPKLRKDTPTSLTTPHTFA
ncbi:phospholipase C PLC-C [Trichoderma velutinum]